MANLKNWNQVAVIFSDWNGMWECSCSGEVAAGTDQNNSQGKSMNEWGDKYWSVKSVHFAMFIGWLDTSPLMTLCLKQRVNGVGFFLIKFTVLLLLGWYFIFFLFAPVHLFTNLQKMHSLKKFSSAVGFLNSHCDEIHFN